MSYDNTNSGTLGKNRNPKNTRSPHYTGKLNVTPNDYWISGWKGEDFVSETPFISLLLSRKDGSACTARGKLNANIKGESDYIGTINFKEEGVTANIEAWTRMSGDGGSFLSLKMTGFEGNEEENNKEENNEEENNEEENNEEENNEEENNEDVSPSSNTEMTADFDDDIPF